MHRTHMPCTSWFNAAMLAGTLIAAAGCVTTDTHVCVADTAEPAAICRALAAGSSDASMASAAHCDAIADGTLLCDLDTDARTMRCGCGGDRCLLTATWTEAP